MNRSRVGLGVALLAGLAVAGSGCYGPGYGYGQPYGQPAAPAVVVGPGPVAPAPTPMQPTMGPMGGPMMMHQLFGVGASAGVMITSDEGLDPGGYIGANFSVWLNPYFALDLDVGTATFAESLIPFGYPGWDFGEVTITPITVNAIFSVPDPNPMLQSVRWRLGAGFGVAATQYNGVALDPLSVFTFQAGSEFLLGGMGRVFFVFDVLATDAGNIDNILETGSSVGEWWDVSSIVNLRAGIELGF